MSQPWSFDHVLVHSAMLRQGWRERDRIEVRGQVIRLVVAGPGSFVNHYPVGNSGRARVRATLPMPITDDDLRTVLSATGQPVGTESAASDCDHTSVSGLRSDQRSGSPN
ncbi:MAG: DUF3703 domain-containing protein, partial [Ilumatobacteraceae bacterium]|nr:DUF3703 domain-containing protein [Ilumatobacteraceae bacterium]